MPKQLALVAILCTCLPLATFAADTKQPNVDEIDFSAELPRIPPTAPADALKKFIVQPGFRVEQVAAEPLVNSPVAVDWDEDGRMFVVEMRGYSEHRDENLSRVSIVIDDNGDGIYDRSSVFVDKLLWPTAVACWDGGAFIADAPDIFYCKDTDGDGCADVKKKVFTGFSTSNVQGLLNCMRWTLDNRIHGSSSTTGGEIKPGDQPTAKSLNMRGRDFSFDPRLLDLRQETGGGQHGMSFDDWGRKFVCSNSNHIQQCLAEDRYLSRNPFLSIASVTLNIATDGAQAEVFRSSPVEPWRVVRTRLRVTGAVKGAVEGGGRAAGYFTGATGVTIYRGDQYPSELKGMAVIGDVGSNLVHRKKLTLDGVQYSASRIDDKSEFVASTDIWFRPAQYANGPDGCLYILDVCREVIEHPASIPQTIKKHLDLDHGRDRGRIYRVVPDRFTARKVPKFSTASIAELCEALGHPNAWQREAASRVIFTRQDQTAVEPLKQFAKSSKSELGRMHALYALDGLKALKAAQVEIALADESPRVREHAIRLSERVETTPAIVKLLAGLLNDPDNQLRYQLAFTLGQLPADAARAPLVALLKRDYSDRWMRLALLSSLPQGAADVAVELLGDDKLRDDVNGRVLLATLATQSALEGDKDGPQRIVAALDKLPSTDKTTPLVIVRGLSEGLARKGRPLSDVFGASNSGGANEIFQRLLTSARQTAGDAQKPVKDRLEAIQTLALANFADVQPLFKTLLDSRQAQEVQQAGFATLGKFTDPAVATIVVNAWPTLSPRIKTVAAETLLARPERIVALLDAIEKGDISASEIEAPRIQLLTGHRDPAIRSRSEKVFASLKLARRQDVVDGYRASLKLSGDVARGKQIFGKICAACHRVENVGHEIGPSLSSIKNRGPEAILLNVLDPSREVNPQFVNYLLLTDDGRALTGMIAGETATSVTLKRAENQQDTVLRINIDELRSTGLSIMPEGIEKQLDQQGLADVIAYLMQAP